MALSKIESRATNRLFYSHHSFISPAIIIHTPDARIMAASAASRKSHCFFSSLFFSDWLLCVAPMKMRVPAQTAPSSVRRIGATSSCLIGCMKWRALFAIATWAPGRSPSANSPDSTCDDNSGPYPLGSFGTYPHSQLCGVSGQCPTPERAIALHSTP